MKATVLPSSNGTITNSLALNREIGRAVGSLEILWQRTGRVAVPAGVADMRALTAALNAYLDETFGPAPEEE